MMLAPDPAVPQRDALLDEPAISRRLSLEGCARVYAKYRVGESLRVAYRTERGDHVAARTFREGASASAYRRALARAVPVAALEPVIHAPELDAVFWTFPNDRRLTALPLLDGRSPELGRLLGGVCARTRIVAYAPERSASAQCLDDSGRVLAYAKVQAGEAARRERGGLDAVGARIGSTDPHLRVPRVIGASDADGALAVEAIDGRRLDGLTGPELGLALGRLGAALATLHSSGAVPAARFERLDAARLARAVGVIARARPDAGGAAAELLAKLLARHEDSAGPLVCLHGDPNLRNAIALEGRVALLDFEELAAGPAAADLGQLLAGLIAARVERRSSALAERSLAAALLNGYAAVAAPPPRASLRWHTAASVLARRALTAVNRLRARDLRHLHKLLEEAFPP
jgi:aminoglycoside phosphotransferase